MSCPPPDDCVLRSLVDRRAHEQPDKPYAFFEDGSCWTYAELANVVRQTAARLQASGVRQGDVVPVWMPNGADALRVLFAINYIGAICAPLAISLRGGILENALHSGGARLLVADPRLLDRLAGLNSGRLETVVTVGPGQPEDLGPGLHIVEEAGIAADESRLEPPPRPIAPSDTQCVLFTSGTTGPAKGVLSTYLHRHEHATALPEITADDRRLIHSPLSHTGGFGSAHATLVLGGSMVLVESFSTDRFFDQVNRFGVTVTSLLGATIPFLLSRPESESDRSHGLRLVLVAPVDQHAMAFSERYGVPLCGVYSMTEMAIPVVCRPPFDVPGQCGIPRPGYEARIVDAQDFPVADSQPGELVIRSDRPWTLAHGYLDNPEATARAWRNGWFHTGDLFRQDAGGQLVYVGRQSDSVRRRGENVSAFEVENEIARYPGVREAAVVGVPSEMSEEEVLAAVTTRDGIAIDPVALTRFLQQRLPHFMVPRYLRLLDELPHTPTQKVDKARLKAEAVTGDTWDARENGVVIRRDRL